MAYLQNTFFEKYLKGAASYAPLFSPDTRHIIIVKFQ